MLVLRGKNHEITLKDSFNILIDNNFRLIDIGFPRINGLFKNKNLFKLFFVKITY